MGPLLRGTWDSFRRHDGELVAAAIAFYAVLAAAPVLVIGVVVMGMVFGEEAATGEVATMLFAAVGRDSALVINDMVADLRESTTTGLAATLSAAFLLFASTRLFHGLRTALNRVWGVRLMPGEHMGLHGRAFLLLRQRAVAFVMVLLFVAGMFLQLFVKTALSVASELLPDQQAIPTMVTVAELFASWSLSVVLIALVYRLLPDARIAWGDVIRGALVTGFLMLIGAYAISTYLTHAGPASLYGAAGSVIVLLVWVYYTAHAFLLGAEFTGVYARARGQGVRPSLHAVMVIEADGTSRPPR